MLKLLERAREQQFGFPGLLSTDYINTIPPEREPWYPGDEYTERRIRAYIRWNAAVIVSRANRPGMGVGGHIATYASAASLYEVGFNHFFRGKEHGESGDQVFFQGHAAPGIYARAFLEGRLTEHQLNGFRQELSHPGGGLPSYPHPRLMPDFWEFPTVSMGLGPMNAIYQARFNRYLAARGLAKTQNSRVWAFLGDGEMDEPEATGALTLASREGLDNLTDDQIKHLRRGGHDYRKLYAAYTAAVTHQGAPTVILAKTVKGWTLGSGAEARNITHQKKKLNEAELKIFRDRLQLPIPEVDAEFAAGSTTPVSTTMVFARILRNLIRDPELGPRIVPIIPDEARTFGMDPLFKEVGIYAAVGQRYEPVDSDLVLSYREAKDGQVLEEGITEAGSVASLQAAATSYASHGFPMIPFYIFYSMFGFQRTGDQIWAFGDARGRGFLMGATAGRTTLTGEGLQHDDGHSHLLASTVPNIRAYDPAFAYELATVVRSGIERMYVHGDDVFYYVTLYN